MDTSIMTMVFLAILLLILGVFVVIFTVSTLKKQEGHFPETNEEASCEKVDKKLSMEFSKIMLLILLSMWVLGGMVGFWVVLSGDSSMLLNILDYIETPVMTGVGVYGAKSGVENWKKLSTATTVAEDTEEGVG